MEQEPEFYLPDDFDFDEFANHSQLSHLLGSAIPPLQATSTTTSTLPNPSTSTSSSPSVPAMESSTLGSSNHNTINNLHSLHSSTEGGRRSFMTGGHSSLSESNASSSSLEQHHRHHHPSGSTVPSQSSTFIQPSHQQYSQPPISVDQLVESLILNHAADMKRESDVQLEVLVEYNGNFRFSVTTELIVNQPTPAFITLPLTLTLTGFAFTGIFSFRYL
jgi:hypothetical protein